MPAGGPGAPMAALGTEGVLTGFQKRQLAGGPCENAAPAAALQAHGTRDTGHGPRARPLCPERADCVCGRRTEGPFVSGLTRRCHRVSVSVGAGLCRGSWPGGPTPGPPPGRGWGAEEHPRPCSGSAERGLQATGRPRRSPLQGLGRCQRLLARRSLLWCLGLIWTRLPPANQERRSEVPLLVHGQYAGSRLRLGRLGLLRRGAGEGGWGLCPPPTQQRPTPWATAQEEVEPGLGGRGSMASRQHVACLWGQLPGKRPHLSSGRRLSGPGHQEAHPQTGILLLGDSEPGVTPAPPPPAHSQAGAHLTNANPEPQGTPRCPGLARALPRAFL